VKTQLIPQCAAPVLVLHFPVLFRVHLPVCERFPEQQPSSSPSGDRARRRVVDPVRPLAPGPVPVLPVVPECISQ
jgi:hypothetical protein